MFCTISTEVCENPVISKKTGHIYERSLLEKHLKITGKCPVTEEDMTMEDVVQVKGYQQPSKPKPPSASSIPSLLKTFQNEWDQMMLESYNLKKHGQDLRQQLSHALYQHDAACRVIARLTQERDRAQQQLANTKATMSAAVAEAEAKAAAKQEQLESQLRDEKEKSKLLKSKESQDIIMSTKNGKLNNKKMTSEEAIKEISNKYSSNLWNATEISPQVKAEITDHSQQLSMERRTRKKSKKDINANLSSIDKINKYKLFETYELHSEQEPGILCMDLHTNPSMQKYIVTGGIDCRIILFNRDTKKFDHILDGHTKQISSVKFHPTQPIILSSSYDNTSRVWRYDGYDNKWKLMSNNKNIHSNSITGLDLHCIGCYYVTSSLDNTWSVNSLIGKTLLTVNNNINEENKTNDNDNNSGLTCIGMHPDGQLLGTGCINGKKVKIWDIRDAKIATTFEGHESNINCVSFNENGYYLGSCDDNGICKIWDLRKAGKKDTDSSYQYTIKQFENKRIKTISFDRSGSYLAIGQPNGIEILQCKKWNTFASFYNHNRDVTGIKFGENCNFIASVSRDRKLNVYGSS